MKKMFFVVLLLFLCGAGAYAADVWTDGSPVVFSDVQPYWDDGGRFLVPLRPVAESLGLQVKWDETSQCVSVIGNYTRENSPVIWNDEEGDGFVSRRELQVTVGSAYGTCLATYGRQTPEKDPVLEESLVLDVPAIQQNGRVIIPLNALTQWLHCTWGWNVSAGRAEIISKMDTVELMDERYGVRFDWSKSDRESWTCLLYFDKATPPKWSVNYDVSSMESIPAGDNGNYVQYEFPDDVMQVQRLAGEDLGGAIWGVYITRLAEKERDINTTFHITLSAGDDTQFTLEKSQYLSDPAQDWNYQNFLSYEDKRNERGRVDVFEQARVLTSLGIECPPRAELQELQQQPQKVSEEYSQDFESAPNAYTELLSYIGWVHYDLATWTIEPRSKQVFALDYEFYDVSRMYDDFLQCVQAISGGEYCITEVKNDTSGVDWQNGTGTWMLSFLYNGHPHSCELTFQGDFLDPSIADFLNEVFEQEGNPKRLLNCGEIWLYNTPEWAKVFAEKTLVPLQEGSRGEYLVP